MFSPHTAGIGRREALRRISFALGGIATAPLASGLLSGCRTPGTGEAYTYRTLAEPQQRQLAALVERIIPTTDTPGAAEAGVPQFVDLMLSEWYAPEERDAFLAGLADVDRRAQTEGGAAFTDLDEEAQGRLVAALDAETFAPARPDDQVPDEDVVGAAQGGTYATDEQREREVAGMQGDLGEAMTAEAEDAGGELSTGEGTIQVETAETPPFFRQLKELTLAGYYTSEVGATEELQWLAAPGRYVADAPLSEIGRAWA